MTTTALEAEPIRAEEHVKLVHRVAKIYADKGVETADLVGQGMIVLVRAARSYDPQYGAWSTYAWHCLCREMVRMLDYAHRKGRDRPMQGGEALDWTACARQPDPAEVALARVRVEHLLRTLPKADRQVVVEVFGLEGGTPQTFEEIGSRMGVTRQRIKQRYDRAIRRMKMEAKGGAA